VWGKPAGWVCKDDRGNPTFLTGGADMMQRADVDPMQWRFEFESCIYAGFDWGDLSGS